jgi:hypothetical protein
MTPRRIRLTDENVLENPYLKIFLTDPLEPIFENLHLDPMPWERMQRWVPFARRKVLVKQYAWAVPNDAAIKTCVQYSPLVEIGAGTGYWASVITKHGGDVVCYDKAPYKNTWADGEHFLVTRGGPNRVRKHRDRTLFLCWPPLHDPMAYDALRAYRGRFVLYVGEGGSGCTGDKRFHRLLEKYFDEIAVVDIPQYGGIHDTLMVFQRKERT